MIRKTRAVAGIGMLLFCCFFANVPAVSAQGDVPRDVRRNYPEEVYIVRPGTGETAGSAAQAARLEIAKFFESKISGETVVHEWAQSRAARGNITEQRFTELTNNIIISASRDIPGIEIAYTEQGRNAFVVWAVLERARYSDLLRERIVQVDEKISGEMGRFPPDDLNHLRVLTRVLDDLLAREQARQDLALLEAGNVPPSHQMLLYQVMSSIDSLIAEAFDVAVVPEGDIDPQVRAGLIKGITDTGIRIREYPDFTSAVDGGSDMVITFEHTVTPRVSSTTVNNREFAFHFSGWVLSVTTMDPTTREVMSSLVMNNETNGSSDSQARERMIKRILDEQVSAVTDWVYDTIFKPEG
ncbi:hypothetical protein ACFL55_02715 [Candidatus Latescibacterota bacterium]